MKFCFVGIGSIATKHILALKEIDSKITIHAFRTGKSQFISKVANLIDKEIFDFELLDEKYDAVFICNPTNLHYETLKKFKNKADYFFVEKPIFDKDYTTKQLEEFSNLQIYVACPLRYQPAIIEAKKTVEKKGIPISARIICSSYLPEWRPTIDYRNNYSAHKDMGGGVSIDLIHEVDYMTYLFGFPQKDYYLKGTFSNLEIDSDDLAVHLFQYPKLIVEMHLDYFGRKNQRYLEMFYNDETIKFDIINNKMLSSNGNEITFEPTNCYFHEMKNFIKLIKNEKHVENTLFSAVKNLKLAKG